MHGVDDAECAVCSREYVLEKKNRCVISEMKRYENIYVYVRLYTYRDMEMYQIEDEIDTYDVNSFYELT